MICLILLISMRMHKLAEQIPYVPSRRSTRERRSAIDDDFQVYLSEDAYDVGDIVDPKSSQEVVSFPQPEIWMHAMNGEMQSMSINGVWEPVELPKNFKTIGYKWVFKTKKDLNGNIEIFKARPMAKDFI
ncbi:hypothetical protein AAZX31_14G161600 [Glycine max]